MMVDIDNEWNKVEDSMPPPYTDVHLKCEYGDFCYVTVGQLANGKRIKSDVAEDIFFRSAIVGWRAID